MPTGENDFNLTSNSAYGVSALRVGHAQYSFATDGGLIGLITPANNCTIPLNAVIYNVAINVTTACVGASGTMSVGMSAGGVGAAGFLGATAVASLTLNSFQQSLIVPQTASGWKKQTAAGNVTVTIATTNFSAGVVEVYVFYYLSAT